MLKGGKLKRQSKESHFDQQENINFIALWIFNCNKNSLDDL